MRKKNIDVAKAWSSGQHASSYNGNFRTDGTCLWSYNLKIGTTVRRGRRKVLADYTAKSGNFLSKTTSSHVGIATPFADIKVGPEYFEYVRLSKNTNSYLEEGNV